MVLAAGSLNDNYQIFMIFYPTVEVNKGDSHRGSIEAWSDFGRYLSWGIIAIVGVSNIGKEVVIILQGNVL